MTPHPRRRLSVSVALAGLLAGAAGTLVAPAVAAPAATSAKTGYTCESPSLNGNKLDITFTISATPAKIYVGRSATPKLVVNAIIPGNIVALAAFFGVKSASATGTFSIKANGATTGRPFVFPRTDIPQTNKDFPVTISVGLPALHAPAVGAVTYKPGPIALTLVGYKNFKAGAQPGDDVGSVAANCTAKTPNQVVATTTFVKSPTAIGAPVAYAKATKKVTSSVTVVATSGVTPYGKVTSVLYRGSTKLKTVVKRLAGGKTSVVFGGVAKKGTYKVVTTYAGSGAHVASKKTKIFTVG